MNQSALSSFICSVADLLRGDYKPHEYGSVILSFTVLRRLDCVLVPTDPAVIGAAAAFLASQDSSFMTASEVAIDGGLAHI